METKTGVLVVLLCLGAAGVLGGLLTILKPQSTRESEAVTAPANASSFAQRQGAGTASAESASKLAAADDWNAGQKTGGSLGFVRGAGGLGAGGGAGQDVSPEAAAAAAAGDAKGLIAGLKADADKGMGKKAVRELMQWVVDTVHKAQPRWYNEFLDNDELKGIADTYDKTMDFPSFVRQLGRSPAFRGMLKRRNNTSQLRQLTKKLLDDEEHGSKLSELFFAHAKDADVIASVRQFGPGAGLPSELLDFAGAAPRRRAAKPKVGGSRPKLQPRSGFGGGFKGNSRQSDSGGGDESQLPAGIDASQLQQYQKYLKK
ncbi:MAG: hypothetical protein HYZ75_14725 [Elusimicrobia bacterium]|nr:hypothetical protein [Elusimicrobiota bacterium]